jgi:hypothetical protein
MVSKYSIKNEGFTIFNINIKEFQKDNQKIFNSILKKLPNYYQFLDYEYKIVNSTVYTFHRDVTSSKNYQGLVYPSYTLIIYINNNNNKLLSICPNSHKQKLFISPPINIYGRTSGCGILFDADIVHAGAINETSERTAFQYKICHKEDIYKLKHLNGQYIEKIDKIRHFTLLDEIISFLSYKTIPIFDTDLGTIIEKKPDNIIINKISEILNINFYINS